jgi:hypothetical protein
MTRIVQPDLRNPANDGRLKRTVMVIGCYGLPSGKDEERPAIADRRWRTPLIFINIARSAGCDGG